MQLAILAHAFSTDLRAALDRARRAGASGVVLDPSVFPDLITDSQTARREIVALLARAEQPCVAIDVRLATPGLAPTRGGDVEREVDRARRAIDVARGLLCPLVCCDLGALPPAPDEPLAPRPAIAPSALGRLILPDMTAQTPTPRAVAAREPLFESNVEHALREIGALADRAGVLVAFRASLGSVAALAFALSRVDCPYFGIDADPLALLGDEWSLDEAFARVGTLVRHVRARDGLRGSGGRSQSTELGAGQVDWDTWIANLRDADYRGPITVDPTALADRAASGRRGLAFLRERLAR